MSFKKQSHASYNRSRARAEKYRHSQQCVNNSYKYNHTPIVNICLVDFGESSEENSITLTYENTSQQPTSSSFGDLRDSEAVRRKTSCSTPMSLIDINLQKHSSLSLDELIEEYNAWCFEFSTKNIELFKFLEDNHN
jgi:hypothetical protein